MTDAVAPILAPLACPVCQARVDVKSPHVLVAGASIRVYCSAECLRQRDPGSIEETPVATVPTTRRVWWWLAGGLAVGTTCLALAYRELEPEEEEEPIAIPPVAAFFPAAEPPPAPVPAVSAIDAEKAADEALLAELAQDAWLHPLAGPTRRMPANHNGAFGASRPGERPPECVSGHCGVDLGNVWGEPVHAAHGGVIDFVHRGPNEERGGIFVKISHRGGKLFTWYFHLAAVPKWIQPGTKVTAGQMIGLLGDTGIKHSAPHLHFAISVRPATRATERYLDPEPLIAIWPLWIPNENRQSGRPSVAEEPGVPVRAPGRRKPKRREDAVDAVEPAATSEPADVTAATPAEAR